MLLLINDRSMEEFIKIVKRALMPLDQCWKVGATTSLMRHVQAYLPPFLLHYSTIDIIYTIYLLFWIVMSISMWFIY